MTKFKPKYIDLFAGCGGLSLGLYNTGRWDGVFALEKNAEAFETLRFNLIERRNHFIWPDWLPQTSLDINYVISHFSSELRELRGKIDLVAGGPPCQGFSTAGRRDESDKRNQLIHSYIKFIRLVQPKVIFFENVRGFTLKFDKNKLKGRIYSEYVQKLLARSSPKHGYFGYEVYGKLVNFSEFGIPQKRTRFILVGVRKDRKINYSPASFFELLEENKYSFLEGKNIGVRNTLQDAISDLVKQNIVSCPDSKSFYAGLYNLPSSNYQKLLRHDYDNIIPDSHRFAQHRPNTVRKLKLILLEAEKNRTVSRRLKEKLNIKKHTIIPLARNCQAPTITTLPDDYIHYSEPRILTVREHARIQSFNDWYEFKGTYTTGGENRKMSVPRYSQVGNAIPPLFAEQSGIIFEECFCE